GRGTTFHIFIPHADSAALAEDDHPAERHGASMNRRAILLVEDDESVAAGIAAFLREDGVDVRIAADAAHALAALREFRPDAVVLDFGLPDMDGIQLYAAIAATWPHLPVVFSTGHGDRTRVDHLLSKPGVAFLQKPYDVARLLEVLDGLLAVAS
ncbi:MAG TPA: response regulator, partial [Thermoanaerobaculia bacterium]|nr:response regulator [Thermoanaerobaculia bacterium]